MSGETETYSKGEVDGIVRATHDDLVSKFKQTLIQSIIEMDTLFREKFAGSKATNDVGDVMKRLTVDVHYKTSRDIAEMISKSEFKIALSQEEADFYRSAGATEA